MQRDYRVVLRDAEKTLEEKKCKTYAAAKAVYEEWGWKRMEGEHSVSLVENGARSGLPHSQILRRIRIDKEWEFKKGKERQTIFHAKPPHRPLKYGERTVRINLRIPATLHATLTAEAKKRGQPLSEVVLERMGC